MIKILKKLKKQKKYVIKRILKFNDYKNCLRKNKIIVKSQQRFKSGAHNVYTKEINKIALSSNDDKGCKLLIELQHIHMEQMLLKYVKVRCLVNIND